MQEFIGLMIFICGFVVGWNCLKIWATYRAKKILSSLEVQTQTSHPKVETDKVNVEITREGDQCYVYDAATGEFLAQGSTKEEIIDILTKKYPTKSFNASADNMKEVGL